MERAIFLDRDGIINMERGTYTYRIADFEFVPGIKKMLKKWQSNGYHLIIITNQSGIANGIYSHNDFQRLNNHMLNTLKEEGIHIQDVFYCPHHPTKTNCLCRKPNSLLFEKAIARYKIAPKASYVIGDKERDTKAGAKVGLHTIRVNPNTNLNNTSLSIK